MGAKSDIEWTDASWTPIRARRIDGLARVGKVGWYCEHATTGCEFCYAETMNRRLGTGLSFKPGHRKDVEIFLDDEMLLAPLRWKKPRMIFVCSMTDLFADFVADEWIDKVFAVMALCPQHTFQVLTKRAERMRRYMTHWPDGAARFHHVALEARKINPTLPNGADGWTWQLQKRWPLPNVWLGVSAERQQEADERIPLLLQTPVAVRFISAEPLLGPIDLRRWALASGGTVGLANAPLMGSGEKPEFVTVASKPRLDWVIVGGESGPGARPMHPDWARSLRDQCAAAGVPMFFKQWGSLVPQAPKGDVRFWRGSMLAKHVVAHDYAFMRVGKKAAGRLLDGKEHNAMPLLPSALAAPQNKPAQVHQ